MLSEQTSPDNFEKNSRLAGPAGNGAGPPPLNDADLLEMYRTMVLSRTLDQRIWQMNRQGRAAIVASAQGHEAAQVGAIRALDPERDRFYIYYRELTTMLALGITPLELLLGFLAKDGEPLSGARQFPLHGAIDRSRRDIVSFSNVVATQMPQAVGVSLADKMRGEKRVTVAYFGDGASSMGETHEAMNFASIHRLPIIFFCENNKYAISVPLAQQMNIESVATRAAGYGIPGIEVNGFDPVAVYEAVGAAANHALAGDGPTLVEAVVERFLPHTSDDDDTLYRSPEDLEGIRDLDPIPATEKILRASGVLDDAMDEEIKSGAQTTVNQATEDAENAPFPEPHDFYEQVYAPGSPGDQS
ncbi:MAG: thiamine pyrophosphate-dependent dehydrogenase E1 component subunit alpha [Dehalococcoidia bacterium]|jgi:2-oxoisovalerate dehydrogenase E1 component alpha subunit|nr:thiamine pyrophosphate-dependent dehydrogenase E1 component subunit alpha [Dehalococcoidia bacterium]